MLAVLDVLAPDAGMLTALVGVVSNDVVLATPDVGAPEIVISL